MDHDRRLTDRLWSRFESRAIFLAVVAIGLVVAAVVKNTYNLLAHDGPYSGYIESTAQIRRIAQAVAAYRADHDDRFPPAARWESALAPKYLDDKPALLPPPRTAIASYTINRNIAALPYSRLHDPANTVLFFESPLPGPHASGGPGDISLRGGFAVIGFADGTARAVPEFELGYLGWTE